MPATATTHKGALRGLRAFTLVELIVVILVLGILAAVAVMGYSQITSRAHEAAAKANLRNIATAVLAERTVNQGDRLTRDGFFTALDEVSVNVVDGLNAGGTWTLYGRDYAPSSENEFAVGFDYATTDGADDNDDAGTRAVVVTSSVDKTWARIILLGAAESSEAGDDGTMGQVPNGTTASDVPADPGLIGDPGAGEGNQGPGNGSGGNGGNTGGNGGNTGGNGSGQVTYGAWQTPEEIDYTFGPYTQPSEFKRTAVWNWGTSWGGGAGLDDAEAIWEPISLFARTADVSGQSASWITSANEYKLRGNASDPISFNSSGRMAVYQIGDDGAARPTSRAVTPDPSEWPDGVTGIEVEGPGHYTGPIHVEMNVLVDERTWYSAQSVLLTARGYVLEGPQVPTLSAATVAAHQPQDLGSWIRRATVEADPDWNVQPGHAWAGQVVEFDTTNWPISLMVAPEAQVTGVSPVKAADLAFDEDDGFGQGGRYEAVTEVGSLLAYAPYQPPRWRYVYGA